MAELSYREQVKHIRQEAKKRFQNPYKVGDILHHSWGYDQTNCDFYQVVEVKPASVVLKKIGAKPVPGSEGFMSQSLIPEKGAFITQGNHALTKYDSDISPDNSGGGYLAMWPKKYYAMVRRHFYWYTQERVNAIEALVYMFWLMFYSATAVFGQFWHFDVVTCNPRPNYRRAGNRIR